MIKKGTLILGKGPAQGLDGITLTAEKKHSIRNINGQQNKFCPTLYYDKVYNYVFVNGVEIYRFKARDSEINVDRLCLGNVSNNLSNDNIRKAELYRYIYDFSVGYYSIDVDDILDIHKCLMNRGNVK